MGQTTNEIIRMQGITKIFPGVKALSNVDFLLEKGTVHALIGENGAGKSTLIKTLMGVYGDQYEGQIYIDGQEVKITNPIQSRELGMLAIYQDITLAGHLTVGENFFLGSLPKKGMAVDWKRIYKETGDILKDLGIDVNPKSVLNELTVAQQEMVSIAKAVKEHAKVVVFDEPTALLTDEDTKILFSIIRRMKAEGVGIIYISHRMEELFEICDVATILKDGEFAGRKQISETTEEELVSLMVGREVTDMYQIEHAEIGEEVLRVEKISKKGVFHDISLDLHKGEILGLFGLVGSGRTETVRTIFGAEHFDSGAVYVNGEKVNIKSPSDAIAKGIGFLPENRREQGLCLALDIATNINLATYDAISKGIHINLREEKEVAEKYREKINIKTPSIHQKVKNLSGGNQQKVVIGKWLDRNSKIFIFDEPTVGIDVLAKREIYRLLEELVKQGNSIILISSYLPEVLGLADRVIIFHEGKTMGEISSEDLRISEHNNLETRAIMAASGIKNEVKGEG